MNNMQFSVSVLKLINYEKGKLTPFSITNNRPSCLAAKLGVQAICPAKGALELFHLKELISLFVIMT